VAKGKTEKVFLSTVCTKINWTVGAKSALKNIPRLEANYTKRLHQDQRFVSAAKRYQ
jgi:hypothetical protein